MCSQQTADVSAKSVKTYEVKFTRLAEAFLGDSKNVCEEKLRGELARDLPEDFYPPEIMFHCFKYNSDDHNFIAKGRDTYILVDTVTFEETDPLPTGPLKGKRIQMPRPDSED